MNYSIAFLNYSVFVQQIDLIAVSTVEDILLCKIGISLKRTDQSKWPLLLPTTLLCQSGHFFHLGLQKCWRFKVKGQKSKVKN